MIFFFYINHLLSIFKFSKLSSNIIPFMKTYVPFKSFNKTILLSSASHVRIHVVINCSHPPPPPFTPGVRG